ncbi:MAG: efflux RND transporter periplasmic adaptor subunit [Pseudomonadota bacterium]
MSDAQSEREERGWLGWLQIAIIAILVIAALVLTARLAGGGGEPARAGAPQSEASLIPVRMMTPERGDHQIQVRLTGTVEARAIVALSPQVGGRVETLAEAVREGGRFEAGEPLFTIDRRDYQVAVARASASLADAQSALLQIEAEAQVSRNEWTRVYPDRDISPLAAREPQLAAARARVEAAEADLAQARLNLERTRVSFPFSGRVVDSRIEAGQLLIAGQSYGAIYDASALEIVAPTSPQELARLDGGEGRAARLVFEDGRAPASGAVARIGAQLDERSRLINLFIAPEDPASLRPGLFVEAELDGPVINDVMRLPAVALVGLDTVHIVRDGLIEPVRIEVLDRSENLVIAAPFPFAQGVIVSPLPEGAAGGQARIVERGDA